MPHPIIDHGVTDYTELSNLFHKFTGNLKAAGHTTTGANKILKVFAQTCGFDSQNALKAYLDDREDDIAVNDQNSEFQIKVSPLEQKAIYDEIFALSDKGVFAHEGFMVGMSSVFRKALDNNKSFIELNAVSAVLLVCFINKAAHETQINALVLDFGKRLMGMMDNLDFNSLLFKLLHLIEKKGDDQVVWNVLMNTHGFQGGNQPLKDLFDTLRDCL